MSRAFSKKRDSDPRDPGWTDAEPSVITDQQVWNKALGLQARREHSSVELTRKLEQFGASVPQIEDTLKRLAEYALQSDDRFAESLVRTQLARGRGQRAIRQALQQRGLDAAHPALLEQTAGTDWQAMAVELLQRRFGPVLQTDAKEKARHVRFLQYRGFSLEQALGALQALSRQVSNSDPA